MNKALMFLTVSLAASCFVTTSAVGETHILEVADGRLRYLKVHEGAATATAKDPGKLTSIRIDFNRCGLSGKQFCSDDCGNIYFLDKSGSGDLYFVKYQFPKIENGKVDVSSAKDGWFANQVRSSPTAPGLVTATKIAEGWTDVLHMWATGRGNIYTIDSNRDVKMSKFAGTEDFSDTWTFQNNKVGDDVNKYIHAFSDGSGGIYGITEAGDVYFYKHAGTEEGVPDWTIARKRIARNGFKHVPESTVKSDHGAFGDGSGNLYIWTRGHILFSKFRGHEDGSPKWDFARAKVAGATLSKGHIKQLFAVKKPGKRPGYVRFDFKFMFSKRDTGSGYLSFKDPGDGVHLMKDLEGVEYRFEVARNPRAPKFTWDHMGKSGRYRFPEDGITLATEDGVRTINFVAKTGANFRFHQGNYGLDFQPGTNNWGYNTRPYENQVWTATVVD